MFNSEDSRALLELLLTLNQAGQVDPDSTEFKEAEKLIKKLFRSAERTASRQLNLQDILDNLENRKKLIQKRKEVYLEEDEARKQILIAGRRAENLIKEKIALLMVSEESTDAEIEALQQELKVLHKTNKEQDNYFKYSAKGAAMAESMLQATLGISKSSTDIMGFVKGFGKGLKKSVTASSILASTVIKVFEMFVAVDGATSGLFKKTGMTGYTDRIVGTGKELALAFGVQSETVSAELFAEVMTSRRSFGAMASDEVDRAVVTAGKLSKLGVSVGAYVDIGKYLSLNLDENIKEQEQTLGVFYKLAKDTKTSPEEMFREVANSLPTYSRYLDDFPRVFAGIHLAARKTNVSITDLMTLTESLDTTDQALKQAQKFNALLGGNFLNPVALLAADPGEKVKLIAEAYRKAQEKLGQIHPRVVRSLYQNFGIDAQRFKNIVNAGFESFDAELDKAMTGTPSLMQSVEKDIEQSKSAGEKVENALAAMFKTVFSDLVPMVAKIVKDVTSIARAILKYHPVNLAMMLFEELVTKPKQQKNANEERKRVEQEYVETIKGAGLFDTQEQVDMYLESQRQGPLRELEGTDIRSVFDSFSAREFESAGFQKAETRKKGERASKLAAPMSAAMTMMDSPVAMSVGAPSPTMQVPTVDAKYETSNQDDVLLSRLGKLRDKIHEYRQKSTKINLNVGLNNIAEATV
jgi:hypothetical protein